MGLLQTMAPCWLVVSCLAVRLLPVHPAPAEVADHFRLTPLVALAARGQG